MRTATRCQIELKIDNITGQKGQKHCETIMLYKNSLMSTDPKLTQTLGNIQTLALGFKIVPIYTTVQWRIGDWKYTVGV